MLSISDIIRTNREQQHISQEELSFGICSVSTLSRIETGVHAPGRATYEALMERLGQDPELFPSFLSEREVSVFRLKHQISKLIFVERYEEAERLLDELDSSLKLEHVYKQFVLYIRALLIRKKGQSSEDALVAMKRVADMSIRNHSSDMIIHQVLSKDDVKILNSLAISYYNAGEQSKGIDLLYALKNYIERKVVDDDGISHLYTTILYNLSKWVGLKGHLNEAVRLCGIGIQRCIDYNAYYSFSGLLYNKGYLLVMLGRMDEARKYIQESYYLDRARGELELCEIVERFACEHGISL